MTMLSLLQPAGTGFLIGLGLIVAIGAQNAFVLRQGLMRRHVLLVTSICAVSDALLILAGVAGLGTLVARSPQLLTVATLGGAAFLLAYGLMAARRALTPSRLTAAPQGEAGLGRVAAATLAFTFLNPHVYLDTVVLVGSLSARFEGAGRAVLRGRRHDAPPPSGSTGSDSARGCWLPCSRGRPPGGCSTRSSPA
jgi:L-lysine exporter family protein LysE/ArgO